jgi:ribosomal protein L35
MPKLKTHKGMQKRVKITGSGKIKRTHANTLHNAGSKTNKQKRRLHSPAYASSANAAVIKKMLPYE